MTVLHKEVCASNFRTGGTPSTAPQEYWNGLIPWVSAKDFKAFRFEDSEDHVTELALAEINVVHEWICDDDEKKLKSYRQQLADDSEKGCRHALFYVRRTIQNVWRRDVLLRRRSTIRRDSVQPEERQGGEMMDYPYSAPCSYFLICHQELREQLTVGFK